MVSEKLLTSESLISLNEVAKNLRKVARKECCGSFLCDDIIEQNTYNLSEYLVMTNKTLDPQDVSNQTIQHGTELFLYLNTCPSSKDLVRKYLVAFYEFLFSSALSSEQKVLTLSKIINDNTSKDGQDIANKIMARLSKELGFRYYTPAITSYGIIGEKVKWTNSIRNITGRYILSV